MDQEKEKAVANLKSSMKTLSDALKNAMTIVNSATVKKRQKKQ